MGRGNKQARASTKDFLKDYMARRAGVVTPKKSGQDSDNYWTDLSDDEKRHMEAEQIADPLDPRSAYSVTRAERWLTNVHYDREAELVWTVNEVKSRLSNASHLCERVTGTAGPSTKLGFWPDPNLFGDVTDVDRRNWHDGLLEGTRLPEKMRHRASEAEIARMEQAIRWPSQYLQDDRFGDERTALQSWMTCEASGGAWKGRMPFAEHTSYRARWSAFVIITCGLIRDKARIF